MGPGSALRFAALVRDDSSVNGAVARSHGHPRAKFHASQRIIVRNRLARPPVVRANDGASAHVKRAQAPCLQDFIQIIGRLSMSKRIAYLAAAAFSALAITATVVAPVRAEEKTVMVGGAAMFPSKNIIQNAVNSKDHPTLVAAVKAAGLVGTLEGKGPFTVFAPTNTAFGKLPAGTVDNLVNPDNKETR